MADFTLVIPWANREELQLSLTRNAPVFRRHDVDVVIVNAGGDQQRLTALIDALPGAARAHVRTLTLPGARFNRSLCLNIGALSSSRDSLCFLDADIVVDSDLFGEAAGHLATGSRFVAVKNIFESDQSSDPDKNGPELSFLKEMVTVTELRTHDGRRAFLRSWKHPGKRHAGDGLILVRRDHLTQVGGFNSRFQGYGYEDTDFQLRLQFALGLERIDAGDVIHLSHAPTAAADRETWRKNYRAAVDNYNKGNWAGSQTQDAAEWADKINLPAAV